MSCRLARIKPRRYGSIEIFYWEVASGSLTNILEHYERKDPNQSPQWPLFANPSGVAKEDHVVVIPHAFRTFSGENSSHMVEAALFMVQTPGGTESRAMI
jgi:hypothetical protein